MKKKSDRRVPRHWMLILLGQMMFAVAILIFWIIFLLGFVLWWMWRETKKMFGKNWPLYLDGQFFVIYGNLLANAYIDINKYKTTGQKNNGYVYEPKLVV